MSLLIYLSVVSVMLVALRLGGKLKSLTDGTFCAFEVVLLGAALLAVGAKP